MVIVARNNSKGAKGAVGSLAIPLEISPLVSKEPFSSLRAASHTFVRRVTRAKKHLALRDSPKDKCLTFLPICHMAQVITERETPGLQSGRSAMDTW